MIQKYKSFNLTVIKSCLKTRINLKNIKFFQKNFKRFNSDEIEIESKLKNDLIISDIDQPLYTYGMIYKYDIKSRYYFWDNIKAKRKQKFYTNFIFIFLLLKLIKLFICLFHTMNDESIPIYYFDIIQEFGGLIAYLYIAAINITMMSIGISYVISKANQIDLKWLDIIKVLKGISSINLLRINDKNIIKEFVFHVKFIKILLQISICNVIISVVLGSIALSIFKFEFWYFLKFCLLSFTIFIFWCVYVTAIPYFGIGYFYFVIYYCKLRIRNINENVEDLINKSFFSLTSVDDLIEDHNNICEMINNYNKLWRNVYALFVYNLIPYNLNLLHQLWSEELPTYSLYLFTSVAVLSVTFQFLFNFITASVSKEVAKSHKLIYSLLVRFGRNISVRNKLKVINNLVRSQHFEL